MFLDPYASQLGHVLLKLISETNGITLAHTLDLALRSMLVEERPEVAATLREFQDLVHGYHRDPTDIRTLLDHDVARTLGGIFRTFPLRFREEHIHLTGSLSADFVYPRLTELLDGPHHAEYEDKIRQAYGEDALPIQSQADVDRLLRLQDGMGFSRYLQVLTLGKLVLVDREAHRAAAYHMAHRLYHDYNVGRIRLKFTFSRATASAADALPGPEVSSEDVVLGLFDGFEEFRREHADFDFVLSPSFRKESDSFDTTQYATKGESFLRHAEEILALIAKHPFLRDKMTDVDTVGDERNHYRKAHFEEMRPGMRKLASRGFRVRSHHGETWSCLRRGVQAVDNAMNIWHIDTLEHGVSLGVNPNYFFHMVFERSMAMNVKGRPVPRESPELRELEDMDWRDSREILERLARGEPLTAEQIRKFIRVKFHAAREVEHYQHDVLNRMINKNVSLVSLPTSNVKLTQSLATYKAHPFTWWEKKGVELGVGTDNDITLNTNFIRELLILLVTDADNLKITKLLMVVTGETRRPYMSDALWSARPDLQGRPGASLAGAVLDEHTR